VGVREESNFLADLNNAGTTWRRTIKFGRITRVGRGIFLGGQPRPYHKGAGASPFGVPFYLCTHPLMQN